MVAYIGGYTVAHRVTKFRYMAYSLPLYLVNIFCQPIIEGKKSHFDIIFGQGLSNKFTKLCLKTNLNNLDSLSNALAVS